MQKMTSGKILPCLLKFSLPLVIGSIFQLTYNLFDFIVLGWFSSDAINAQASLSVASPIFNIFISLISGLCVGFAIHSSALFGKNDIESLKRQFTSFLIVFGIASILLILLFNLFINPLMTISNVKDLKLKHDAMLYLGITSLGFIFCFIYNLYASFLRALGDSLASLIFLIISCILNIVLNIIFVIVFKMEIVGVALSTIISQFLSAISVLIYGKVKYKEILSLKLNEYVVDTSLLKVSASYAITSALQQIVLFVGKYIVSIKINEFDAYYIAAYGGATKIDEFVFSPTQNFGHATSIFMSQNRGNKDVKRFKQGFLVGFMLNLVYGVIISLIIGLTKSDLLNLFIKDDVENRNLVINYGVIYLSIMSLIYLLPACTNSIQAFFRGSGKLNMVFYSTSVQIIARVVAMLIIVSITNKPMESAALACMIGWITMISFELPFLIYNYKRSDKIVYNM